MPRVQGVTAIRESRTVEKYEPFWFQLPLPPMLNNLYYNIPGRGRGLTAEGKAYKATAAAMAVQQGVRVIQGHVAVAMRIYRKRDIGDADAYFKAIFDALKGIAYTDDSMIRKFDDFEIFPSDHPRVEMKVRAK